LIKFKFERKEIASFSKEIEGIAKFFISELDDLGYKAQFVFSLTNQKYEVKIKGNNVTINVFIHRNATIRYISKRMINLIADNLRKRWTLRDELRHELEDKLRAYDAGIFSVEGLDTISGLEDIVSGHRSNKREAKKKVALPKYEDLKDGDVVFTIVNGRKLDTKKYPEEIIAQYKRVAMIEIDRVRKLGVTKPIILTFDTRIHKSIAGRHYRQRNVNGWYHEVEIKLFKKKLSWKTYDETKIFDDKKVWADINDFQGVVAHECGHGYHFEIMPESWQWRSKKMEAFACAYERLCGFCTKNTLHGRLPDPIEIIPIKERINEL
jgi:hypothetical protein